MENEKCVWGDLFDDDDKKSLKIGYFPTGLFSIVLAVWFNLAIEMSDLWDDPSYNNLSIFTRAGSVRRMTVLLVPFLDLIGRTGGDQQYCKQTACVETFMGVLEIESLTHVCIERFVMAKYATKGWPMTERHYSLFKSLCLFFAALYTFLPLFGFGGYALDFSCNSCTFNMILPDSWAMYIVVAIYLLRYIKPTIVMLTMLVWACILEENLKTAKESNERRRFTKNTITITFLNLFCWTPITILRGGVVFSQLVYSYPVVLTSAQFIKWAMWLEWVSPAWTVLMLFIIDEKVRNKMLLIPNSAKVESKRNVRKTK